VPTDTPTPFPSRRTRHKRPTAPGVILSDGVTALQCVNDEDRQAEAAGR
jgi:hypothetical protein